MKVDDLRNELINRGLDSSGLKPELVSRLEAALNPLTGNDNKEEEFYSSSTPQNDIENHIENIPISLNENQINVNSVESIHETPSLESLNNHQVELKDKIPLEVNTNDISLKNDNVIENDHSVEYNNDDNNVNKVKVDDLEDKRFNETDKQNNHFEIGTEEEQSITPTTTTTTTPTTTTTTPTTATASSQSNKTPKTPLSLEEELSQGIFDSNHNDQSKESMFTQEMEEEQQQQQNINNMNDNNMKMGSNGASKEGYAHKQTINFPPIVPIRSSSVFPSPRVQTSPSSFSSLSSKKEDFESNGSITETETQTENRKHMNNINEPDQRLAQFIQCARCRAVYEVANVADYRTGRKVMCSICSHKWWQSPVKIQTIRPGFKMVDMNEGLREKYRLSSQVGPSDANRRQSKSTMGVYIGGLPTDYTREDLCNLFQPFGFVEKAFLVTHPNGMSKGFGFVNLKSEEEEAKAIQALDGYELNGKILGASMAKPRSP
eukprot:CAMPEP_0114372810 /NCGR_PEP_ID=MMETSP0101-20121206/34430_1 /TAXON_ID=38822 ORGANISM="Pteridomonas danica, Strain PT" /NCGR_SAMPLE_ID=MMETSP0101 /ASSEMBLY_ACC=CAM_ASM_000211 /LENGTH=490 /DNA_ID=CAMNT_0001525807 /DNA_START=180 /DNA_END=1652 /DNA_ORIENTATION=-